jgi:hypothetical protein
MRRCIDPGQAKNAQAMALPAGDAVDQFAGADKSEVHGFQPKKGGHSRQRNLNETIP